MSLSQSIPDRTGKTSAQPDSPDEEQQETRTPTSSATSKSTGWRPALDSQQSTNEQDMKRKYQERLMGIERGKEAGFSSKCGGDGDGASS